MTCAVGEVFRRRREAFPSLGAVHWRPDGSCLIHRSGLMSVTTNGRSRADQIALPQFSYCCYNLLLKIEAQRGACRGRQDLRLAPRRGFYVETGRYIRR